MIQKRLLLPFFLATLATIPTLAQLPSPEAAAPGKDKSSRADAYYNFTIGHFYELQMEYNNHLGSCVQLGP